MCLQQREFEAWVTEVKKAPAVVGGAQWEVFYMFFLNICYVVTVC
jgi:hypothetical protein